MLIINADDWGRSVAETDAALKCFRERRITSVSAMVFMLDSKRAAKLTKDYELDDVGLHLNFSEEFTDKSCSKTLKETQGRIIRFLKRSKYAQLLYNPFLGEAFASSYRAQVEEFMRLFEKLPSHIDGHHHMHLCANLLLGKSIPAGMRLRRNFSSLSCRSVKSRTTLANPRNSPLSSLSAVVMALAQKRDPSFRNCQPSAPKWPSAAVRLNSSCNLAASVSSPG